jgi:hypothetical protein
MTEQWMAYDPEVSPPYVRTSYPRLRDEESLVLRAFLNDTGTDNIDRLRTAVPVGDGEVDGDPSNRWEHQKKALSQWKIDAVVDRPGHQEIIELKSRATHTALGQLLAYDIALGEDPQEPTESRRLVVGFRLHPDLQAIAEALNIRPHTVPAADPSSATERFLEDVGRLVE